MKSRWFLSLAAIIGLALFSGLSVPVTAATPTVKLVLGGTGSTSWNIGNIKPGDSGVIPVNLYNAGSSNGSVTIWLSDIVNSEGLNPKAETGDTAGPGELGNYLLLNLTGGGIQADFALPARPGDYPQSTADAKHLFVKSLMAGGTLNLQWEWLLPPGTGNDVQGDRLSFTIHYVLEQPVGNLNITGTPPAQVIPQQVTSAPPRIPKDITGWLIPAIIIVAAGAATIACFIVFILVRRRRRWEWIPYILPGAVNVLAKTTEQRTRYTARHQKRVAQLAGAIAWEMNLSKLNGSGQKLVGNDVLVDAGILAVADTMETMADTVETTSSTNKPYNSTKGMTKALEEIKVSRITWYNSEVFQAFLRLVDRGKFKFQTHY